MRTFSFFSQSNENINVFREDESLPALSAFQTRVVPFFPNFCVPSGPLSDHQTSLIITVALLMIWRIRISRCSARKPKIASNSKTEMITKVIVHAGKQYQKHRANTTGYSQPVQGKKKVNLYNMTKLTVSASSDILDRTTLQISSQLWINIVRQQGQLVLSRILSINCLLNTDLDSGTIEIYFHAS